MTYLEGYKVVTADKSGIIALNHKNKTIIISDDIDLCRTDEGKLKATFKNQPNQQPTFSDFLHDLCHRKKSPDYSDCSITIDNPALFRYCSRKDGEYTLFGGGVTFEGTEHNDQLTMYECQDTEIDLGGGNDTVKISGAPNGGFLADFKNNTVKTGKGNDTVTVSGNFNTFTNNKFFLGKGSDSFSAEINPEQDKNVMSVSTYDKMSPVYGKNVVGSEVYATDATKGLFERDFAETKTFSANKLSFSCFKAKNVTSKPLPDRPIIPQEKPRNVEVNQQNEKTKAKPVKADCERRMQIGNLRYMLYDDKKGVEDALKAQKEYVDSMEK